MPISFDMAITSNDKIKKLFDWCLNQTKNYKNVKISNFTKSWQNGLGFCAILHRYGPEYIDYEHLIPENVYENCQLAFQTAEKHFGIPALLKAKDMVIMKTPDRLSIITYLLQFYSTLAPKRPKVLSIAGGPLSHMENISDDRITEDNANSPTTFDSPSEQPDQLTCEICSEIIYFLETLSVSDKFYHRSCYRQTQLSNLKARNKTLERPPTQPDNQVNTSNGEVEISNRRSRIKSLSPDVKKKTPRTNEKTLSKIKAEEKNIETSDFSTAIISKDLEDETELECDPSSVSSSKSAELQIIVSSGIEQNESNIEIDNCNRRLRMRSLSPQPNGNRPPSLDGHLDKMSIEISASKSLYQLPTDRSSPSASSANYISINASSTDTLSKSDLGTVDDASKKFPNKLYPSSLNTSTSSLNSSLGKKRRAPPPPTTAAMAQKTVSAKAITAQKKVLKPKYLYPEDLNPFAEFEDPKSTEINTNPFAEYMNDSPPNNFIIPDKPKAKPRKRVAPKLPPKPLSNPEPSIEDVVTVDNQDILEKVSSNLSACVIQSTDNEVLMDLSKPKSNDSNAVSLEFSSSSSVISIPEVNNEITQTSDSVQNPEPVKIAINVLEKSKSNDSLHLLISSHNNKNKPPAPPRPAPQKREVRADTSYEFIPYESLYSELEEVNQKQSEMEIKARSLQDSLVEVTEKDEGYEALIQQWLEIVEKKNAMYSKEHHLHEILKRQELEDRHSDLEYELRILMGKQESLKTAAEKAREEELLTQILDTVNARAQLVEEDEELCEKSNTIEVQKKKSSLKKIFSTKHRSSSLGKTLLRFKTQKHSQKILKTTPPSVVGCDQK